MSSHLYLKVASCILAILLAGVAALGQSTSSTLVGTVRDSTGAIIPGATVTIANVQTNISSTWTTNEQGDFTAPFQLPGDYRISVEKTGFKKAVRSGITL